MCSSTRTTSTRGSTASWKKQRQRTNRHVAVSPRPTAAPDAHLELPFQAKHMVAISLLELAAHRWKKEHAGPTSFSKTLWHYTASVPPQPHCLHDMWLASDKRGQNHFKSVPRNATKKVPRNTWTLGAASEHILIGGHITCNASRSRSGPPIATHSAT